MKLKLSIISTVEKSEHIFDNARELVNYIINHAQNKVIVNDTVIRAQYHILSVARNGYIATYNNHEGILYNFIGNKFHEVERWDEVKKLLEGYISSFRAFNALKTIQPRLRRDVRKFIENARECASPTGFYSDKDGNNLACLNLDEQNALNEGILYR